MFCFLGGKLERLSDAANRTWIHYSLKNKTTEGTFNTQVGRGRYVGSVQSNLNFVWEDDMTEDTYACPSNCYVHGKCDRGTCICDAGHTGMDCGDPRKEHPGAFIYLYDLPPGFNVWRPKIAASRNTAIMLYEHVLRSRWRTQDPNKARLFWLPVAPMGSSPDDVALIAMKLVMEQYPYYNRSGGRDHVVVFPWDNGACWVANDPLMVNVVKVSHFGLRGRDLMMSCSCKLCGTGGDFIIPDMMELPFRLQTAMRYNQPDMSPRHTLMFFSGGRTGRVRNLMLDTLATQHCPGCSIHTSSFENLATGMKTAKYCLAPPGSGFTNRGSLAIILGCVPVFVGDLKNPFEEFLNYTEFSITVGEKDIPNLVDIVQGADYIFLKARLDRVWQSFSWFPLQRRLSDEPEDVSAPALMFAHMRKISRLL